jgi:hypothetical protein
MQVNQDFADLFAALNAAEARYLLVGGYAVSFHAEPRFTKDLDIWVEASPVNAARVHEALVAFGAPLAGITPSDLSTMGNVVQIGVPPNRIDVVTSIDGVEFLAAWPDRVVTTYGDHAVPVIGKDALIRNKRASGRPQDLLDVEKLTQSGG